MPRELPPRSARRERRAARALREAPRSPCPHCGRETATVSGGVCADCWGVKDPERAIVFHDRRPRTWPLFDWDWDWDLGLDGPGGYVAWVVAVLLVAAGVVVLVDALV